MKRALTCVTLAVTVLIFSLIWQHSRTNSTKVAARASAAPATGPVSAAYGSLPLSFEANRGQTDPRVQFLSRGNGYNLFLTSNEAVLSLQQPAVTTAGGHSTVVRMRLLGSQRSPQVSGVNELPGKSAYFVGGDPTQWHSDIPNYGRVHYRNVFPGIDLAYYGHQGRLEYDFVLAPGADPGRIRIAFSGTEKLRLDNGDVVLNIPGGNVRLHQPTLYQEHGGAKTAVDGRFVLAGKREVAFQVGAYDKRAALVIDPGLVYSTYLGGSNLEKALGIAADSHGNAYVTGSSASADFPTTKAALQGKTHSASTTAFIAKLNPTGTALMYSTYLGGSNADVGRSIAVNEKGEAFVAGSTYSSDFPTTAGAVQRMPGGGKDAFVAQLSANGSHLLYATYLGGSGDDEARGLAVNAAGEAHVAGVTDSGNFPVTENAAQKTAGCNAAQACSHGFATKLSVGGSALLYSTLLGGSGHDFANTIALDLSGAAYIAGHTYSKDFPVTAQAFQTKPSVHAACVSSNRHCADAFVTKLSSNGVVLYSTRLGGDGDQRANAIAVDAGGSAYIVGRTDAADFPTTAHALSAAMPNHGGSAFVTKLNSMGSALQYSTYLGGGSGDEAMGIAVDDLGRAMVAGSTASSTFPTTSSALQRSLIGSSAAFLARLNERGSALSYSTLLSGSRLDAANAVAVDRSGNVYVAGNTESKNFPVSHALRGTLDGQGSAFVAKFALQTAAGGFMSFSPNPLSFNNIAFGTTSSAQTSTLTNTSTTSTFTISSIALGGTNSADFALQTPSGACAVNLVLAANGGSCTITATFTPRASGGENATVTVGSDAVNSPQQLFLQGTGAGPFVSLSATSLTFLNQAPATSSVAQTVTMQNVGTSSLNSIVITKTGTNAADYTVTTTPATNCGGSLAVAASCTISVVFKPATTGARVAAINIADNAFNTPQTISLLGNPPVASITPSSLLFPSTAEGTVAKILTVTLTNTAKFSSLSFVSATVADTVNYQAGNNCPAIIPATGSCTITVGFQPQKASATFPSTLTIADNSLNNPAAKQSVTLKGSATAAPVAKLSKTSLVFTTPMVQATPHLAALQTLTFTITNTGSGALNVNPGCGSNVCSNGSLDFTLVNAPTTPCGTGFIQLAQGASCNMAVQFTPQFSGGFGPNTGTRPGVLRIGTNAGNAGTEYEVFMTGTATGAGQTQVCLLNSSPCANSINFGSVIATSPTNSSLQKVVAVTNTGNVTTTLNNIFLQRNLGQFSINTPPSNQCTLGMQLAPNATCNIGLIFSPTLSNNENGLRQTGNRTDILVVRDNAGNNRLSNSDHYVTLTGNATGVPAVTLGASSVVFGSQAMGTTSARKTVTVKNSGTAPLFISGIVIRTSDFQLPAPLTNACPVNQQPGLAVGATCNIDITFGPAASTLGGTRTDVLSIRSDEGNNNHDQVRSSRDIYLTGTATGGTNTFGATFSATMLNFPDQPVSTLGAPLLLTLTNTSNYPWTSVTAVAEFNSFDFFQPITCGNPNVPTNGTCTFMVYFQPFVLGRRSDTLDIGVSGSGGFIYMRIPMTGVGTGTQVVTPSVAKLSFSAGTPIGGVSVSQQFTLTNTGTAPTAISAINVLPFYNAFGTADFAENDNCPRNQFMPVGSNCVVTVNFTPQSARSAPSTRTATLYVEEYPNNSLIESAGGSVLFTQTVGLTGVISGSPALTVTPGSLTFMDLSSTNGDRSNPLVITLQNTGTATLSPIPSLQTLNGEFSISGNTCSNLSGLAPGQTCNLWLVFQSNILGQRMEALIMQGNMSNTPSIQFVPMTAFVGP
jgi:hypothetical protein